MRNLPLLLVMTAVLSGACSAETEALGSDDTVRVPVTLLTDPEASIPENAGGIDLEEFSPSEDLSFCDAFASAPARWVDDSVVPVQFWIDSFTVARSSAPSDAAGPIDRLIEYGERKLAWNFGQLDERPVYDSTLAADARAIADVAVAACPDLPLVAAPDGRSDAPDHWADNTPEQIAAACQSASDDVAEGIEWYTVEFATVPGHQQQIETAAYELFFIASEETGEYPEDAFLYFASDWYGVGPDGQPKAVPGGACDR